MIIDNFAKNTIADEQINIDANALLAHHLLITGATGSGKSTSLLKLVESLQSKQQATIILDPTGEYHDLAHSVQYKLGQNANLDFSHFSAKEIADLLGDAKGTLVKQIEAAMTSLKIQKNVIQQPGLYQKVNQSQEVFQQQQTALKMFGTDYDANLLLDQVIQEFVVPLSDDRADYSLLGQVLDYPNIKAHWLTLLAMKQALQSPNLQYIFNRHDHHVAKQTQTDLFYILKLFSEHQGQLTLVIDISALMVQGSQSRLILSILLRHLLVLRATSAYRFPITLFLDESHRFIPAEHENLTESGLFKLIREGRKYGLYVALSTQSPLDLPAQLRGQFGSILIHQLNDPEELNCLVTPKVDDLLQYQRLQPGQCMLQLNGKRDMLHVNIMQPKTYHATASPLFKKQYTYED